VSLPPIPEDWLDASQNGSLGEIAWLGDVTLKPVEFVERPLLQAATFHLLAGRPEVGKGALCARWISRCTNGEMYNESRIALWLSTEEDPAIDLGPRIEVAGGDRERVGLIPRDFTLPRDIDWLHDKATATPDLGLIVIDYLESHDGNSDTEVRRVLQPLAALASELSVPVIGIRHISVKEARGNALGRILGSTAWVGVPRVVMAAVKDKSNRVHVHPIKGNRVSGHEAGREYALVGRPLLDFPETIVCCVERGVSEADVDELLAGTAETVSDEAREILLRIVNDEGEVESDSLDARVCAESGLAPRTVRNQRFTLQSEGWLRASPQKALDGTIEKWWVRPSATLTSHAASMPSEIPSSPSPPNPLTPFSPEEQSVSPSVLKPEVETTSLGRQGGAAVSLTTLSDDSEPGSHQMPLGLNGDQKSQESSEESLQTPTLPPDAPEWEKRYWESREK